MHVDTFCVMYIYTCIIPASRYLPRQVYLSGYIYRVIKLQVRSSNKLCPILMLNLLQWQIITFMKLHASFVIAILLSNAVDEQFDWSSSKLVRVGWRLNTVLWKQRSYDTITLQNINESSNFRVAHLFRLFCVVLLCVLCSEFRVVMFVAVSP